MKKTCLLSGLVVGVLSLGMITQAHSATVYLDYVFADGSLSGGFSYDDTSGTVLSGDLPGFTAFTPGSVDVTYSSGGTTYSWDLGHYDEPSSLPGFFTFLPTIDPFGAWATPSIRLSPATWTSASFVNAQGATLIFSDVAVVGCNEDRWCTRSAIVQSPVGEVLLNTAYETSPSTVPIPTAILLFGSGLLGLIGIARKQASL